MPAVAVSPLGVEVCRTFALAEHGEEEEDSIAKLEAEVSKLREELRRKDAALVAEKQSVTDADEERKRVNCMYTTNCNELYTCREELKKVTKESSATGRQLRDKKKQLQQFEKDLKEAWGLLNLRGNGPEFWSKEVEGLEEQVKEKAGQLKEFQKCLEETHEVVHLKDSIIQDKDKALMKLREEATLAETQLEQFRNELKEKERELQEIRRALDTAEKGKEAVDGGKSEDRTGTEECMVRVRKDLADQCGAPLLVGFENEIECLQGPWQHDWDEKFNKVMESRQAARELEKAKEKVWCFELAKDEQSVLEILIRS